jgi:GH43 family beta-xylosidase
MYYRYKFDYKFVFHNSKVNSSMPVLASWTENKNCFKKFDHFSVQCLLYEYKTQYLVL